MNVRSATKKAASRLLSKEDKKFGIINYDEDNCYPQRVLLLTNSSPTAKACIDTYGRFIEGGGFKDTTFYKSVVNSDGQTMDKILRLVRIDLARYRGFAIHVNVALTGKITEIFHVPFEHVRKATKEKQLETGYRYAIYTDWNKQIKNAVNPQAIDWMHPFNLSILAIMTQAEQAGGWENYKGQLIYVSQDEGSYPLASCDSVLENIFAEIQSDISTTNNIEENFTAKGILIHKGKFATEQAKEDFEDDVEEFIGAEGASLIVVDIEKDEDKPEFLQIPITANDKVFEYTDKKTVNKIIRNWLIPKILLSVTDDGAGFFNQEQIRDATLYYNSITNVERVLLEETFGLIAKNFISKIYKTDDFSIIPIEFKLNKNEPPAGALDLIKDPTISVPTKRQTLVTFYGLTEEESIALVPEVVADPTKDKRLLIDIIGIGGVQALQGILADTTLTMNQKKSALMIVFGLNEADAAALAGPALIPTV